MNHQWLTSHIWLNQLFGLYFSGFCLWRSVLIMKTKVLSRSFCKNQHTKMLVTKPLAHESSREEVWGGSVCGQIYCFSSILRMVLPCFFQGDGVRWRALLENLESFEHPGVKCQLTYKGCTPLRNERPKPRGTINKTPLQQSVIPAGSAGLNCQGAEASYADRCGRNHLSTAKWSTTWSIMIDQVL